MTHLTLGEFIRLNENRDSELTYTEKKVKGQVDKVILTLEGNKSGVFTKLIKEYSDLKTQLDILEEKRSALNAKIKDKSEGLFDAEDEVLTRVIETVSATMNLSKKTVVTSTKVDYEKVIALLLEMVPGLTDKVEDLITANTKVSTTPKSPALRVDLKEGIMDWFKALYAKIESWTKGYDADLKSLNEMIAAL